MAEVVFQSLIESKRMVLVPLNCQLGGSKTLNNGVLPANRCHAQNCGSMSTAALDLLAKAIQVMTGQLQHYSTIATESTSEEPCSERT